MALARFMYSNLITSVSMITVSSLRVGIVTAALKDGTGSAVLNPSGSYSGTEDLEYILEIDSIAGGAEVGQATFKWSDGGGTWDANAVTTSATNILLNNGVYVNWTTGSGADFVVGDKWYFKGINLFSVANLIDLDRDHRYRAAALGAPNTFTIDLGAAKEIKVMVLQDHNFTSAATLLLEGDDAATFDSDGGSAQFSEAFVWNSEKIIHYLSTATTKRHWRISVTDAANTDSYIEVGEIYLGSYMELSKNYAKGFSQETEFLRKTNVTPFGVARDRFYNFQKTFEFPFELMLSTDITSLKALAASLGSRETGAFKPFWFNDDSAFPNNCWLVKLDSLPINNRTQTFYDVPLTMVEVVASV